jgi:membrane protein implicated in regulation of membrane protease activity
MEINQLKADWQKLNAQEPINPKSMEQINAMIAGKTDQLVASVKKKYETVLLSLMLSMLAVILLFPLLSDGFTYPGSVNGYVKGLFFYMLAILFVWLKYRSLNDTSFSNDLRTRLAQLIGKLQRSKRIDGAFIVTMFAGMLLVGRFVMGKGLAGILKADVMIAGVLSVVLMAGLILYITRSYNRRIRELEQYLSEFDEK